MRFVSVSSTRRGAGQAAAEITRKLHGAFDPKEQSPDLILFFATPEIARHAERVSETLHETWPQTLVLGVTSAGVFHPTIHAASRPALVAVAAHLPGVVMVPIRLDLEDFDEAPVCMEQWQSVLEIVPDPQLVILLPDPFTTPIVEILDSLRTLAPEVPVIGGQASGANRPGGHVLLIDEHTFRSGVVGVALAGNIRADVLVSQGCKPIGDTFTVTKAEGNTVLELSGNPAIEALQEMVAELPKSERNLLQQGLMFGQAIEEPRDTLGRGDFLIRPVVAVDHKEGTISLAGHVHEGQIIRFHVWDNTLADDLYLLMVPQLVDTAARGGLLFGSWPGRGKDPGVSIRGICKTLGYPVPMGGFLSSGELGPIRGTNYLHTHTASLALFRPADESGPGEDEARRRGEGLN